MRYSAVAELNIRKNDWVSAYANIVARLVDGHGGRYVARTALVEHLEGERPAPSMLIIVEWPSKVSADALFRSRQCQPYRHTRMAGVASESSLPQEMISAIEHGCLV